jgi:hypothetical protein
VAEVQVAKYLNKIRTCFTQIFRGWSVISTPEWLDGCRWKPHICLGRDKSDDIIAIDIVPSGVVPRMQYRGEVRPLLARYARLRVIVCVVDDALERHPDTETFCGVLGIGLKIYHPSLGMETVLRIDVEAPPPSRGLPDEHGWFPKVILERARNLARLSFRKVIQEFAHKVEKLSRNRDKTCQLVTETIDRLMQSHPTFRGNVSHFLKLEHFERLFELAKPGATEHVLHSFRVFLAGCAIIDAFYDHFCDAHKRYKFGASTASSVEYAWLLASVFHDIGRPKEGARTLIEQEIGDEDIDVQVTGKQNRWQRPEYQTARKSLAAFAIYVASNCPSGGWDGGLIDDAAAKDIETAWMSIYDLMKSHAIIGSLDFLARVFLTASAADERKNRPFVVSHAVPARNVSTGLRQLLFGISVAR